MGTRAAFFIGDARDVNNRTWLGCIAWDGYPWGDCRILKDAQNVEDFYLAVQDIKKIRDDFCDPNEKGFPFPWDNDLFLTDCVYAFFNNETYIEYNRHWVPLKKYIEAHDTGEKLEELNRIPDPSFYDVPAPTKYDSSAPDSITIVKFPPKITPKVVK